jgi:succinyl-CoA synthetase beta subunit
VLDRSRRRVVLMASSEGGVEIEQVAAETPDKIVTMPVHPFLGLRDYQARQIADNIGLPRQYHNDFIKIAHALYRTYIETDASLAEINPLVITGDGRLLSTARSRSTIQRSSATPTWLTCATPTRKMNRSAKPAGMG